ncbi:MAG: hypothetical protein H7301_14620 [Cryobacterium sp.]|nr:hypothetical protein [Oligoflexia bacterium]
MTTRKIVIIGAGGFARETEWLLREINRAHSCDTYEFQGYVVSDLEKVPAGERAGILGDFDWLDKNRDQWDSLAIGIGTPALRVSIPQELDRRFSGIHWPSLVHPSARMDAESTHIGRGTLICSNVIGTVNLRFEEFSLVNLACTIGHEAVIGKGAVLNPSVNISGGVKVGNEVLIGTGAQVLQYLTVGDGAQVGAGSVVTKDVAAGVTVVGVPAKPLRAP